MAFSKILKNNVSNSFLFTKAKAKTGLLAPNLVQSVIISSVCLSVCQCWVAPRALCFEKVMIRQLLSSDRDNSYTMIFICWKECIPQQSLTTCPCCYGQAGVKLGCNHCNKRHTSWTYGDLAILLKYILQVLLSIISVQFNDYQFSLTKALAESPHHEELSSQTYIAFFLTF